MRFFHRREIPSKGGPARKTAHRIVYKSLIHAPPSAAIPAGRASVFGKRQETGSEHGKRSLSAGSGTPSGATGFVRVRRGTAQRKRKLPAERQPLRRLSDIRRARGAPGRARRGTDARSKNETASEETPTRSSVPRTRIDL